MSKRVLISVFEKENIVEFASELVKLGWEIISTGGTYKILKESGLNVIEVDEVTNFKEILNGRVKTLYPYIHVEFYINVMNKIMLKQLKILVFLQ